MRKLFCMLVLLSGIAAVQAGCEADASVDTDHDDAKIKVDVDD